MQSLYDQVMRLVLEEKEAYGSFRSLCAAKGVNNSTVSRWFRTTSNEDPRSPNLIDVSKILEDVDIVVKRRSELPHTPGVIGLENSIEINNLSAENLKLKKQVEELRKKNEELLAEYHRQEGQIQMLMDFMNPKSKNGGLLAAFLKDKD